MSAQRAALKALLTGNATWAALVTGGTYISDDLPPQGLYMDIPASVAPIFGTDGKLKLTCVIGFSTAARDEIIATSQRQFFNLYLYYWKGHAKCLEAKNLACTLLHQKTFTASDTGGNLVSWVNDGAEFHEDTLDGAAALSVRFELISTRKPVTLTP